MVTVTLSTPAEVAAAVPHLIGFTPTESLTLVTAGSGPTARVDLPTTADELVAAGESLLPVFRRHSTGKPVMLVAHTRDVEAADDALRIIGAAVADTSPVPSLIHVDGDRWHDLTSGERGTITQADSDKTGAARVAQGMPAPLASRDHLVAMLRANTVGGINADQVATTRPTQTAVEEALIAATYGTPMTIEQQAAVIAGLETTEIRDRIAYRLISRGNARGLLGALMHLTRQAPTGHVDAVASVTAVAAWLAGDGALAWVALDRLDQGTESTPLGSIVTQLLEHGVSPDEWDDLTRPMSIRKD